MIIRPINVDRYPSNDRFNNIDIDQCVLFTECIMNDCVFHVIGEESGEVYEFCLWDDPNKPALQLYSNSGFPSIDEAVCMALQVDFRFQFCNQGWEQVKADGAITTLIEEN